MGQFDTHGGYFAPKDYIRINEGGSHEENPYGGVQVGVDPQGVPNMVEEGESIYKDFVFSDNIVAEESFLREHHLPVKFAGKLFSEIADKFVDEAEDRPNDPISNNGLNAMLIRLSECQEAQKQAKEQAELEEELANLSPEELAELEALLAQQEQPEEAAPQEVVGPAEPMPQQPMAPGMPMMRNGGFIRRYATGGDIPPGKWQYDPSTGEYYVQSGEPEILPDRGPVIKFDPESGRGWVVNPGESIPEYADNIPMRVNSQGELIDDITPSVVTAFPGKTQAWVDAEVGPKSIKKKVSEGMDRAAREGLRIIGEVDPITPLGAVARMPDNIEKKKYGSLAFDTMLAAAPLLSAVDIVNMTGKMADYAKEAREAEKTIRETEAQIRALKTGGPGSKDVLQSTLSKAKRKLKLAKDEMRRLQSKIGNAQTAKTAKQTIELEKTIDDTKAAAETAKEVTKKAPSLWRAIRNPLYGAGQQTARALAGKSPLLRYPATAAAQLGQWGAEYGLYNGVDWAMDTWRNPFAGEPSYDGQPELDFGEWDFGCGGKMNKYDGGGWAEFLNGLNNYSISRNRSAARGKYRIDNKFPLYGYKNILELEQSDPYKAFTQYVIDNPNDENVQKYLRALDSGTADWTQKLFDGDALRSNWAELYNARRNDQKGGIYHFSGDWDNLDNLASVYTPAPAAEAPAVAPAKASSVPFYEQRIPDNLATWRYKQRMGLNGIDPLDTSVPPVQNPYVRKDEPTLFPGITLGVQKPVESPADETTDENGWMKPLSTFPRYAAPLMAGALGLYDVFQQPDKYNLPKIRPVLPVGHLDLRDPEYNPLDQEMAVNNVLASNAGTVRALGASGLGPSTGAAIIAADNGATGNIGAARTQVWDANNQRRNDVIAAHNQNASSIGDFDYGISRDRAMIENQAAMQNLQMELYRQRLNYAAEAEKYAAIQSQIDAVAEALAGIGRENVALNQVNSNSALYHKVGPNGYAVYSGKNGGLLKKCK